MVTRGTNVFVARNSSVKCKCCAMLIATHTWSTTLELKFVAMCLSVVFVTIVTDFRIDVRDVFTPKGKALVLNVRHR
jgi:hypothetical protein